MNAQWVQSMRRRSLPFGGARAAVVLALLAAAVLATVAVQRSRDAGHGSANATSTVGGPVLAGAGSAGSFGSLVAPEEAPGASPVQSAGGLAAKSDAGVASAPASSAGGIAGGDLPAFDAGRTIIRNGAVDLEVESVADAFDRVRQVATAAGGFVSDSSFTGTGERQAANLTIRVPEAQFGDVITQLRALAVDVRSVSTSSQDVTAEYTDIEATLANLRAVEAQYAQLLGRASSINDVLQVQDRLNQVRLQIDRTEARRKVLDSQATLSSITVTLRPTGTAPAVKSEPAAGPLAAARGAWHASLRTLEAIATGVLVVVVYTWWIAPLALVLALVARRWWRRRDVVATGPDGA